MAFEICTVKTKKDWDQFIDLPWTIYNGNAHWVPPLRVAVREILDVWKNPFFKHARMLPFVALRNGICVGRIVGIIDEDHNRFQKEQVAFFGFFECIDDLTVSRSLFDKVKDWARAHGMNTLRGPMNPSTNYECGLLVEGFDDPPQVMMTYNPPYYIKLFEAEGLVKNKDLLAYTITGEIDQIPARIRRHAEKLEKNSAVKLRSVRVADWQSEVEKIRGIYNDAWESNWGFVPMNDEEFSHMAKDMKSVVDPELLLIAEVHGEPAAFGLALPDVNRAIHKVKDGRLFPAGIFKLLWHMKGPGRKTTIDRCRVVTLGIKKQYREHALGPLLYLEYMRRATRLGYRYGEASWILEDNRPMIHAIELLMGKRSKAYRIYAQPLA